MEHPPGFIDMSRLAAVCADGDRVDEDLLVQLLGLFLEDNAQRVAELTALGSATAGGEDLDGIRRAAHSLSGSCSTAGAVRLAALAKTMETEAKDGRAPAAGAIEAVSREFDAVVATLRANYPALGSSADEATDQAAS